MHLFPFTLPNQSFPIFLFLPSYLALLSIAPPSRNGLFSLTAFFSYYRICIHIWTLGTRTSDKREQVTFAFLKVLLHVAVTTAKKGTSLSFTMPIPCPYPFFFSIWAEHLKFDALSQPAYALVVLSAFTFILLHLHHECPAYFRNLL